MFGQLYGAIPRWVFTTNTTKAAITNAAAMVVGLAFSFTSGLPPGTAGDRDRPGPRNPLVQLGGRGHRIDVDRHDVARRAVEGARLGRVHPDVLAVLDLHHHEAGGE